MEIQHENTELKGAFFIEENGDRLGEMVYSNRGNVMIIEHTEVSDKLKGKGAGRQLVVAGIEYARKNKLKIKPLCQFAKALIDRVKEYQDVLDR